MSGAAIKITVNSAEVRQALSAMEARIDNLMPAFDDIGRSLETSTRRRFSTNIAPDGTPWRPSRRAIKQGGRTLTDTGRLRDSITRRVQRTAVMIGTNVSYAAQHQFGAATGPFTIRPKFKKALFWPGARHPVKSVRHPGFTLPERPFLGVSASDRAMILRIIERRIRGTL